MRYITFVTNQKSDTSPVPSIALTCTLDEAATQMKVQLSDTLTFEEIYRDENQIILRRAGDGVIPAGLAIIHNHLEV